MALTACSSVGTETPVPTHTLIPSTATSTPFIPTQTPTSLPPLRPADVLGQPLSILDTLATDEQRQIASSVLSDIGLGEDQVSFLYVEAASWRSEALDCSAPSALANISRIQGYRVIFVADETVYVYHTDENQNLLRCAEDNLSQVESDVRLIVDPLAAEMVALARRRLDEILGIPDARLVEITPYTWTDTSLGCPLEGEDYITEDRAGYRIVMAYGRESYILHTDTLRFVLCDAEDEVLPS